MKKGDTVPVNIAGDVVAQAVVERIDTEANTVTLIVPATRVVMGLRTEIDTAPPVPQEQPEPAKQTLITGVDRVDAEGNVIEGKSTGEPAPAVESAPVVDNGPASVTPPAENVVSTESGAVETPTGEVTQTEVKAPEPAPTDGE